ncbi:class E sortase [Kineosporia sp. J2-2]|uniref:Class E sortase n=1 Tax=Kineosporia corallincola TaxID=2835133 RepID=A0ABS5TTA9_9ACTN|nr:sortase [Kineosporia corallincola]MBT0774030.1 class E sortase [Kineosporia corallincola]
MDGEKPQNGPRWHSLWRILADGLGRLLTTGALVVLLFVVHQYWVTDLRAAQAQEDLRRQMVQAQGAGRPATARAPQAAGDPAEVRLSGIDVETAGPLPAGTVGLLRIPRIGMELVVLEGAGRGSLQQGPGHVRGTAVPGQAGNSVIVGHRTTWGAPFGKLDRLRPGDRIEITTDSGRSDYVVAAPDGQGLGREESGHLIIDPDDLGVLDQDRSRSRLTLITCHPRFSASNRLVVVADLAGEPDRVAGTASPQDGDRESLATTDFLAFSSPSASGWRDACAPAAAALLCWFVSGRLAVSRDRRRWRVVVRAVFWRGLGLALAAYPFSVAFDRLAPLLPIGG